jgi:hypothetical protein
VALVVQQIHTALLVEQLFMGLSQQMQASFISTMEQTYPELHCKLVSIMAAALVVQALQLPEMVVLHQLWEVSGIH